MCLESDRGFRVALDPAIRNSRSHVLGIMRESCRVSGSHLHRINVRLTSSVFRPFAEFSSRKFPSRSARLSIPLRSTRETRAVRIPAGVSRRDSDTIDRGLNNRYGEIIRAFLAREVNRVAVNTILSTISSVG